MKKNYSVLKDEDQVNDCNEGIRYREYKKNIRNIQINSERILSELKENLVYYENDMQRKNVHADSMSEFFSNNKKRISELENLYKNGIQNLDIMKNYFSHNKTYDIEISRFFSIFDKFRIQLQNLKNIFDKICLHNSSHFYQQRESPSVLIKNNEINNVIKERSALQHSITELDNMIYIGRETNWRLKLQNYNITQQMKKIKLLNDQLPKIQKILKNIKYYTTKRMIILSITIASFIFLFFVLR
ncbi:hypothetical protein, conserved [Plasmodium gonderi]|uniref:SNARE protein n=1 Tax=Plasmodium gonderi TaxID=77519 RepID=A0A1Y1JQR1_PLAGO|nr:hypothetical protein, conserved [Plasmodium gonderi]GAW82394.1 hypothetical protein, conserved [Plasmodium gonderi]